VRPLFFASRNQIYIQLIKIVNLLSCFIKIVLVYYTYNETTNKTKEIKMTKTKILSKDEHKAMVVEMMNLDFYNKQREDFYDRYVNGVKAIIRDELQELER
jgi:predicted membrane protein